MIEVFAQDEAFKLVYIPDQDFSSHADSNAFIVALDFDGVITSPYALKAKYLNELGYKITPNQANFDTCVNKLKIKIEDYDKATIKAFTERPDVLPLQVGFMDSFEKIKSLKNCKVFIVSSRMNHLLPHMGKYLAHHNIRVDGIINTRNENKLEFLEKINANVFVEDVPYRLAQIFKEKGSGKKIFKDCLFVLFRNVANESLKNPDPSIVEARSWKDLYKIIVEKYNRRRKT